MTQELSRINVQAPLYYHREYENDIQRKQGENYWLDLAKRAAITSAPYVSLYKPAGFALTLTMGATRSVTSIVNLVNSLQQQDSKDIPYQLLQATIAVVSFAGTIIAHPVGMLITTGQDLLFDLNNLIGYLNSGRHEEALICCVQILNNSLYLALFLRGGLELGIASLVVQIGLGLYHSIDELKKSNYLECAGHLGMVLVRGNQALGQARLLQAKWEMDKLLKGLMRQSQLSASSLNEQNNEMTSSKKNTVMLIKPAIKAINLVQQNNILKSGNHEESEEIASLILKYTGSNGCSTIFNAAKANDLDAVKKLLKYGGNQKDAFNGAFIGKSMLILKYMVEDLKFNFSDNYWQSYMSNEWWDGLDYLLAKGAKIPNLDHHCHGSERTPIILSELIKRGAKFSDQFNATWNSQTCLFHKNFNSQLRIKIFESLTKDCNYQLNRTFKTFDISVQGTPYTPLTFAIWHEDLQLTHILLKLGADPNFKPEGGSSPMWCAKTKQNKDMLSVLLFYGAKVENMF